MTQPMTEPEKYAAEFTAIADNVRLTCIELLRDLREHQHHEAGTVIAELADHVCRELDAAAKLAEVYVR